MIARHRTIILALLGLLVMLVGAACGEDEDAGSTDELFAATSQAGQSPTQAGSAVAQSPTVAAPTATTMQSEGTGTDVPQLQWNQEPAMALESGKDYGAILHTNKGDIVVDLLEGDAPKTVNNFVFLANEGYYTNVPFHRIIKDFMIQTGDPTGTGTGGPGYRFADEPISKDYLPGTLAMANSGPNTNGSQFFICHVDLSGRLGKNYTIFGSVVEGMEIVDAIANTPVGPSATGEASRPLEDVTLTSVEITVK